MVTWWNLLVKMGNEDQVEMTRWKRKSDVQGSERVMILLLDNGGICLGA